jgi:DNA-binding NarL/FixJ family response regulator
LPGTYLKVNSGNPITRVLIVDDHELVCTGIRLLLERVAAVEVVGTCGDCASALRLIGTLAPDVVLMDVDLPDGDGIVLTGLLRSKFPAVKVLVLTGRAMAEVESRAIAAGARGTLMKTAAAGELLEALRRVASGELRFAGPPASEARAENGRQGRLAHRPVLPKRESEVLNLVVLGRRNKEIAAELSLSVKTVETYRGRLMKRFDCSSPAELVRHAIRVGLASA